MSKHTPGPWAIVDNTRTGDGFEIYAPNEDYQFDRIGRCLNEYNARLIAVSPELYALAERIARLNKDAGEIGAGMLASLVDEANRIIAKVEQ